MNADDFVGLGYYTFEGDITLSQSLVYKTGRTFTLQPIVASPHEVTQKEYSKYMTWYGREVDGSTKGQASSTEPYTPRDEVGQGDNYPSYYVNWYEAVMYCNLRSKAENLTPCYYLADENGNEVADGREVLTWFSKSGSYIAKNSSGKYYYSSLERNSILDWEGSIDTDGGIRMDMSANGYRLPTVAEWEYLSRAGNLSDTGQLTYSGSDNVGAVAWYQFNAAIKVHEVMTKLPNEIGLYDMTGNVWEWCWDWYADNISNDTPETGPEHDSGRWRRTFRGGSWTNGYTEQKYDYIGNWTAEYRSKDIGFRVVRSAD